jgi:hypothetical protein
VIAKQSREGWFQSRILTRFATEPPRRFAPPLLTQEGYSVPHFIPRLEFIPNRELQNRVVLEIRDIVVDLLPLRGDVVLDAGVSGSVLAKRSD